MIMKLNFYFRTIALVCACVADEAWCGDLSPEINTKDTVGFPYTLTLGRSIHEAQEIYRRTDHYHPQRA